MKFLVTLARCVRAPIGVLVALFGVGVLSAQPFTTYDLVVPNSPVSSSATVVDGTGRLMPANRSFVIGVEGGLRGPLVFQNWVASNPNYPVIIVNKHGTGRVVIKDDGVTYRDGIQLLDCAFIKLLGNNDPSYRYGFEVAQAGRMPSAGVYRISRLGVTAGATTTNVEIAFVEVHHTGFAGIMAKTDPQQSKPETWAANFTMYDVSIHDCYIHDTGGEGMYIGYTSWPTDHWPEVPGYESHEIIGLKIYNNLIERTMWDGFQYASAPELSTAVYNNVVIHSGLEHASGQGNGVQIGAGASGRFNDNLIIDSFGNNLALFGRGYNAVYNNVMIAGDNGVFADNRPAPPPADPAARQTERGSYYSLYHNTIINPLRHAFWSMSEVTVTNFKNNLAVVPNEACTDAFADGGSTINTGGNILLRASGGANFADASNYDYRVLPGSPAIDAGVSLVSADVPVGSDYEGVPRPLGAAPDAGAAESGALSVFLIAKPPATAGAAGSVVANVIGGQPPYAYSWSSGATSASIPAAGEGLYVVTVTDAAGAQARRGTYLMTGAELGAPVTVLGVNEIAAPTAFPAGGTYSTPQTVVLSSATAGAAIRYTLDGTNPSATEGLPYTGALSIADTRTLKAVAYKAGLQPSSVLTSTYVLDDGTPNSKFFIPSASVTASGFSVPNNPALAVDGDLSTGWSSNGDGQWIQFDLGATQRIGFIRLATSTGNARSYTFDLLASNDAQNWTPLLLGAKTPLELGLQKFDITDAQPVRYVRLVGHGSTYSATLNGYMEVEIWGGPSTGPVGPPPSAPTNLVATAGDAQAALSWTAGTGASSYNIKRAASSGGPYATVAAGLTTLSYADTGLTNGTTYYYVVAGVSLNGASPDSNEAAATPKGLPPVAPAGLNAAAADGHAVLGWTAAAKATTYNVKRATAVDGPFVTIATGIVAPTFTALGLTNGTTYYFAVSGVNSDGEGMNSVAAAATPQAGLPGVWHILTPIAWGQAGGGFCPATYSFDSQPVWDSGTGAPIGNDVTPHQSTLTSYANRFWYVDFGPDYATYRITQMWTRYRPNSAGTYNGFALMWWDDDKDNVNDGVSAPSMNFSAGGVVPNVNPQLWVRDRDFTAAPIAPQGRYLVVSTGPTVSSRPNEFAFVGYRDVAAPPAPPRGVLATASVEAGAPRIVVTWAPSLGATSYSVKRALSAMGPFTTIASGLTGSSYTATGLTDGVQFFFAVSASNTKGESANSAVASAVADSTAPVLTVPGDLVLEATGPSGARADFAVTAQDAVSGTLTPTVTPASGTTFPLGSTVVHASAQDAAGNTASAAFTITVRDTTPPTVNVPGDIVVEATSAAGASVTFAVNASDIVNGPVAASASTASGSTFALGTTLVHVTAQDAAGNVGTASFKVTVRDTTAPIIAVPADMLVEATNPSGAVVSFTATAKDVVAGSLATQANPASGSTFPLGRTVVALDATDTAGNSAHASFAITVQDTTAPRFERLVPSVGQLWPVDGKMVRVRITSELTDAADPLPRARIVAVTCNEVVNGKGDGNTAPDWQIVDGLTVDLRAERAGSASDRVYTVTVEGADATGNRTTRSVVITVPHDQRSR